MATDAEVPKKQRAARGTGTPRQPKQQETKEQKLQRIQAKIKQLDREQRAIEHEKKKLQLDLEFLQSDDDDTDAQSNGQK